FIDPERRERREVGRVLIGRAGREKVSGGANEYSRDIVRGRNKDVDIGGCTTGPGTDGSVDHAHEKVRGRIGRPVPEAQGVSAAGGKSRRHNLINGFLEKRLL